ncbi:MAG: Methyltransferase domain [Bacteroidota bacterium]|jgi:trans-aconitate methyltransferase
MSTEGKITIVAEDEVISYYEAIEFVLAKARDFGVYRTHFGMMDNMPAPDYCYLRSIFRLDLHPERTAIVTEGMNLLHRTIFDAPILHKRILDVGCGTAGTLKILADSFPSSQFDGININEVQLRVASKHCIMNKNVKLILENILSYQNPIKYDLIYFIESAFHIANKDLLCQQLDTLLEKEGEITIVDIFIPEQIRQRAGKKTNELFHYLAVSEWCEKLAQYGIQATNYQNISAKVATHITISATEAEYQEEVVRYYFDLHPSKTIYQKQMAEVYSGYVRLQKLLKRGILEYGILKFKRAV